MELLVFHRVVLFANALATHLGQSPTVASVDVVTTEDELGSALRESHHDVLVFARADMVRCLAQWQHRTVIPDRPRRLVLAAPLVFPQLVAEARQVGIDAVLDVNLSAEEFVGQLSEVLAGTRGLPDLGDLDQRYGPVLKIPVRPIAYHDATDIEIVRFLSTGLSDKEITGQLSISHQTVRNRISRILRDSNLENRTQLTAVYLRHEFMHLLS